MRTIPLITGGSARGSRTSTPVADASRLRECAIQYASGMPNSATSSMLMVALSTETHSAGHRPGVPKPRSPELASLTRKAASGTAR